MRQKSRHRLQLAMPHPHLTSQSAFLPALVGPCKARTGLSSTPAPSPAMWDRASTQLMPCPLLDTCPCSCWVAPYFHVLPAAQEAFASRKVEVETLKAPALSCPGYKCALCPSWAGGDKQQCPHSWPCGDRWHRTLGTASTGAAAGLGHPGAQGRAQHRQSLAGQSPVHSRACSSPGSHTPQAMPLSANLANCPPALAA